MILMAEEVHARDPSGLGVKGPDTNLTGIAHLLHGAVGYKPRVHYRYTAQILRWSCTGLRSRVGWCSIPRN